MKRKSLLRRAAAYESAMWSSLFRWILRRPDRYGPGATTFGYLGVVRPIMIMFVVLSAVEIPLFDLIINGLVPWRPARYLALALGGYGLIWMLGLLAMIHLHPHVVDGTGIRIRNSITVDVTIPWRSIAAVHSRYRTLPSNKAVQFEADQNGLVVSLGMAGQTSVDLELREPIPLDLPNGPGEPTTRVRLYADDPKAFVASARERLATPPHHLHNGAPRTG